MTDRAVSFRLCSVSEVTSAITTALTHQLQLHRAELRCVDGADAGTRWSFDNLELIRIGSHKSCDIILTDPTVSRRHAEVTRTPMGVLLRDLKSTNGTFVGPVQIREVFLGPETRFRVGRTDLLFNLEDEVIEVAPSDDTAFEGMVGESMGMRQVFGMLQRVAPTRLTVLITGETGTGKELASRAVHSRSPRSKEPFVVFDCGAAPENLVESVLFGHVRGAFTGAIGDHAGVFEQAHGGTIFLDEIGELPLELQPKLLRLLEQREVRRVGGTRAKSIDVRVVAATNRKLLDEVEAGRFREDLYYRLAVVELTMPPLRERADDLPLLIRHILNNAEHNFGVDRVDDQVMALFEEYRWPGNVREFSNTLLRALPFCSTTTIDLDSLPDALRAGSRQRGMAAPKSVKNRVVTKDRPFKDAKDELIEAFELQYLEDLLERHSGNVSKAAREAQMDRKSITRLMKKHGIKRPS